MKCHLITIILALAAIGCSTSPAPDPEPERMEPDHTVALSPERVRPTPVTISGRNLAGGMKIDLESGEVFFEGELSASLGDRALDGVETAIEGEQLVLRARVPADLAIGIYDLTVSTPDGKTGTLAGAFEVRSIDTIELTAESDNDPPVAGDPVTITATVIDDAGETVPVEGVEDVVFSLDTGNGSLRPARVVGDGVQIIYDTATRTEGAVVRAVEHLSGHEISDTILVDSRAGEIAGVQIEPEATLVTAGEAVTLQASLIDPRGNVVPVATVDDMDFEIGQGNGSLGTASISGDVLEIEYQTHMQTETARVRAVERVSGDVHEAEATIESQAGPAARLFLTATPEVPVAGDPVTVAAELQDENGNMIALTDAGDVNFTRISGRGILSSTALFGGQCIVIYSTFRKTETATIQAEMPARPSIPLAQITITSVGGDPAGVTIVPDESAVGAGEQLLLTGWLTDLNANLTAAASVDDIDIAQTSGPGNLVGTPELIDGGVRVTYEAPNALGQTAVFEATEQVSGNELKAQANVTIVAGPVASFDVEVGFSQVPAGSPFNVELTARDTFGNLANSFAGYVHISDTTHTISPALSGNFDSGRRTVAATIPIAQPGVSIHVEDPVGHPGDSTSFDVTGGGVDHFEIEPVADQVAGTPFPVTVRAIDDLGNLVNSFAGTVSISDSTATVAPQVSDAFSGGVLVQDVTLFRAQPTVVISVGDGLGHTGNSNPFAVSAGIPTMIAFVTPPQAVLRDQPSEAIEIRLTDAYGNASPPAADEVLDLVSDSAGGAFDLDAGGVFDGSIDSLTIQAGNPAGTFYYLDSQQGWPVMTVSDADGVLLPASQTIRVANAGQPARLEIVTAPADQTAGEPSGSFVVELQDAGGTPAAAGGDLTIQLASSHVQARFDLDAGGAFNGSVTSVTMPAAESQAVFYCRDTLAGPATISCSEGSLVGDNIILDVLPGPLDHFEVDQIAEQQAGRSFEVRLVALDAWENQATGFSDNVLLSDSTGSITPGLSGLFNSGERIESVTITGASGADVLFVDDGTGHTGQSAPFVVHPGPVDHFEIDPVSSPQQAGTAFTLAIRALDTYENIATSFIGVVDIEDTTQTTSPPQSDAFEAGEKDVDITITGAAADVVVTVDDGQGHTGQSNPFEVSAGPLDHFSVGSVPPSVGVNTPFDISLQARDPYGNLVEDFSGTVTISDITGTITPTTSGLFVMGTRQQTVTVLATRNDNVIHVDDGDGHTGNSEPFDVIDAQPVSLVAWVEFLPPAVVEGEGFEIRLHIYNEGDYPAESVEPVAIQFSGSGSANLVGEPAAPWPDIAGRSEAVFEWHFTTGLGDSGWFDALLQAEGLDSQSAQPVISNTALGSIPITEASCLLNPVLVDAGQDQQIACGSGAGIGAQPAASGGVPELTFDWTPDFALSNHSASNPQADPDIDMIYSLLVVDQIGCADQDSVAVTIADGPQAAFVASRQRACEENWISFDAQASTGQQPLSYSWDFGGLDQDQGSSVGYEFQDRGWYIVTLTVEDVNGCRSQASLPIGISDGPEPTGPVSLSANPQSVPADGTSEITVGSDTIQTCWGAEVDSGKRFHVLATRGTVTSPDEDGADGIQVRTDHSGEIQVTIRADSAGGTGRLLVMTTRNDRESRGSVEYSFSGSSSLPRVVDFAPSGASDLPPPRLVARFDKPMSPEAVESSFELSGNMTGPIPGTPTYHPGRRTVVFVPDELLDPGQEIYTIAISHTAVDTWGNPLDGNFNGSQDDQADDFTWTFGALTDDSAPQVTCHGETRDPFSPDGDEHEDTTEIRADMSDDGGLRMWKVEIHNPEGLFVRTMLSLQTDNQNDVRMAWDGRDESGELVDNGFYNYTVLAIDTAGNVSPSCGGVIEVDSVLDPGEFP